MTSHSPGRAALPIGIIEDEKGEQYEVLARHKSGGSGVVYRGRVVKEPDVMVAVKFYLIPKQAALFGTTVQRFTAMDADDEVYKTERAALMALNHPSIQRILGYGIVEEAALKFANETEFEVPANDRAGFIVSHFIEGSSIANWLAALAQEAKTATSPRRYEIRTLVIRALTDLMEALRYLHEAKNHQHSDIRADNVLIAGATQRPVLIDFCYAQVFEEALIKTTPTTRLRPLRLLNAPAELEPDVLVLLEGGSSQVDRKQLRDLLFPALDLYQLGKLLIELLAAKDLAAIVTPLDRDFLRLVAQELTVWPNVRAQTTNGVASQISKLADGYWSGAAAPHAPQLAPGHPVRKIALADSTLLAPSFVKDIIESSSFRRLQQLKQLSLLDFVYPSATQTRFDHSLAVYSNAVELISFLVRSPRFTKIFDTSSVTELVLCALLHDINHLPFLHYFQELALPSEIDLFEHFVHAKDTTGKGKSIADVVSDAGFEASTIVRLLRCDYAELEEPSEQIIKSILDSGVDIDKLSYVQGDARFTGVPFGAGVDRRTLLSLADVMRQPTDSRQPASWHLCFEPAALSAVESLLLARYWNFKQIYWHHTNRALGAMVSHVLKVLTSAGHMQLQTYIDATTSRTEASAMDYLDQTFESHFGKPSILRDLVTRRGGLFKRLLSIKSPWGTDQPRNLDEDRRYQLVEALKKVTPSDRSAVMERFAAKLGDVFPDLRAQAERGELLVLLDIPGRPLDEAMGEVFITEVALGGAPGPMIRSPFISTLRTEFLNLSRTVRLFVPGAVRDTIGKERLRATQTELEKALVESLTPPGEPRRGTMR